MEERAASSTPMPSPMAFVSTRTLESMSKFPQPDSLEATISSTSEQRFSAR